MGRKRNGPQFPRDQLMFEVAESLDALAVEEATTIGTGRLDSIVTC